MPRRKRITGKELIPAHRADLDRLFHSNRKCEIFWCKTNGRRQFEGRRASTKPAHACSTLFARVTGGRMSRVVRGWFDTLEKALMLEAQLAGLFEHGTLTGSAREFFVHRAIRSVLPSGVHLGTGRVIGHDGSASRQIDVIVYDARCPKLEAQSGVGMYFVEGVIATIEVKSRLDSEKLVQALDNCASVLALPVQVRLQAELDVAKRVYAENVIDPLGEDDARWAVRQAIRPATYIFAFSSEMSPKSFSDQVGQWFRNYGQKDAARFPHLPRLIASPNTVGLGNDDVFVLPPPPNGSRALMAFWESPGCFFGWLLSHLLLVAHKRLGLRNAGEQIDYQIMNHIPTTEYFQEHFVGKPYPCLTWSTQSR